MPRNSSIPLCDLICRCKGCNGNKTKKTESVLEVHITKGMKCGSRITFRQESDQAVRTHTATHTLSLDTIHFYTSEKFSKNISNALVEYFIRPLSWLWRNFLRQRFPFLFFVFFNAMPLLFSRVAPALQYSCSHVSLESRCLWKNIFMIIPSSVRSGSVAEYDSWRRDCPAQDARASWYSPRGICSVHQEDHLSARGPVWHNFPLQASWQPYFVHLFGRNRFFCDQVPALLLALLST